MWDVFRVVCCGREYSFYFFFINAVFFFMYFGRLGDVKVRVFFFMWVFLLGKVRLVEEKDFFFSFIFEI